MQKNNVLHKRFFYRTSNRIVHYLTIAIISSSVWFILFPNKVSAQSYLLGMIEVNFCNDGQRNKELDIIAKAWQKQDICVEIKNKGKLPVTLNLEFLDSVITDDKRKTRTCNASDRPKVQFGNFMVAYSWDIHIDPESTLQKTYQIQYPIGYSGLSHGCLAYHIAGSDIQDNNMFTIRIGVVKFIDIFVGNTDPIQVIQLSQSPILTKVDNEHIVSFWVENKGNVEEKINVTSIISNIFWFQKEFTFETIIPPNTWMILTTPSFVLPIYGWPYRFKSEITYTPQFNFNIIDGEHPSKLYAWGTRKTQTILFVRTRQSRLTIGIIVLILYSIFRKRKKP